MKNDRMRCFTALCILLLALATVQGCSLRPEGAERTSPAPTPEATPAPTEAVSYTVEYRLGDDLLGTESVYAGEFPAAAVAVEGVRFLGWAWESGERAEPANVPVWSDLTYYAVTRPLLPADVPFLFPGEDGLLRPESPFSQADAARALRALLTDTSAVEERLTAWETEREAPMPFSEFHTLCIELFPPEEAEGTLSDVCGGETETLTRSQAAAVLVRLLGIGDAMEPVYYPDVSPAHPYASELRRAAAPGILTKEALMEQTKDGFLWFDGYLYSLDEEGYFHAGETVDGLVYDANGRYTSGNAELDSFVAETLRQFTKPENTRQEDLKAVYLHVKNDFRYLPRNYYESGAGGWEIEEALTMFQTGKGNCYNYTGVFCALARGLGYNARTWSGTMGTQNQPHSWTEITLDGEIYICDPEIELNYWLLEMYTDNFMMRKENSGGWNYQAVGRPGI